MVSLEQIKLLESKVTKTIDYVKKVTDENNRLKEKLDSYQVRIDELEVLVLKFKDDQSKIEDGILSALDRLNQFEDAVESLISAENTLSDESLFASGGKQTGKKAAGPIIVPEPAAEPVGLGPEVRGSPPESQKEEKSPETGELDIF